MNDDVEFKDLIGKTVTSIKGGKDSEELLFKCNDGSEYKMYHHQSCCENVTVEDICGDLDDILNSPIIDAREETSDKAPFEQDDYLPESQTWTFYIIGTKKGSVTIRWYGYSNGYYSESVEFEQTRTSYKTSLEATIDFTGCGKADYSNKPAPDFKFTTEDIKRVGDKLLPVSSKDVNRAVDEIIKKNK